MGQYIADHNELVRIVDNLKRAGKTIVLGNGCFDILHIGHIRYLRGAKELGDVLIVALNDDSSIRRLKRPQGPFIPEQERVEILSALLYPDYLTLFSEDRVDNLLLKLRPHFHAKGSDYTVDTVPERDTVLSYGGQVAIVGGPKIHSSHKLITNWCEQGEAE